MSVISRIFRSYREALYRSQQRYEHAYVAGAHAALDFHQRFLHQLIIRYGREFTNSHVTGQILTEAERYFQRRDIHFVAIDGTCSRDPFSDFMVFFAAAYGVKGDIHIEPQPPRLRYERWSMDQDVSLVAYVPIPYAEAGDITDSGYRDEFVVDDTAKINLSSIHTRLMQLGEIYLAYQMARSSTLDPPRLILLDLSLSSVLMSTDVGIEKINLLRGVQIGTRSLRPEDGLVVYSHPFSSVLGVPSAKQYRRWSYLVRELAGSNRSISISELVSRSGVGEPDWMQSLQEPHARQLFKVDGQSVTRKIDPDGSWNDSVRVFEDFCDRLFHRRDPEALIYSISEAGHTRQRWLSPEDISYLIAIGVRALIETCWERSIMLVSVAKDSSTQYFSRHYIGVLREIGFFPSVPVDRLPWTDRVLLESLASQLEDLDGAWSTAEFDSVFMTLHVEDEGSAHLIRGVRGNIVNPERLFARSLAQFFHRKVKPTPLMGHVIFVDRLIDPVLDHSVEPAPAITNPELGRIAPFFFGTNAITNPGQSLCFWLLSVLTRNLFPEVIGYPDPLHKADWGAKSVKRRVDRVIASSESAFRSRPLSRLFRTIRDAQHR